MIGNRELASLGIELEDSESGSDVEMVDSAIEQEVIVISSDEDEEMQDPDEVSEEASEEEESSEEEASDDDEEEQPGSEQPNLSQEYDICTDADTGHRPALWIEVKLAPEERVALFLKNLMNAWEKAGRAIPQNHVFDLPDGYELFLLENESNGRWEPFVYGHPTHHRFRSAPDFLPHYVWLLTGMNGSCQCRNCHRDYYWAGYNYPMCRCEHCSGGKMVPDPEQRCEQLEDHGDDNSEFLDTIRNEDERDHEEAELQAARFESLDNQ